jgi:hypothetical protein
MADEFPVPPHGGCRWLCNPLTGELTPYPEDGATPEPAVAIEPEAKPVVKEAKK